MLFVIAVVVVLFLMSKNQAKKREAAQAQFDHYSSIENTIVNNGFSQKFEPGVTNPLYDWYHPKMSAAVASKFLEAKGNGSFVIRDAENTPGWHKMCVKTRNAVVQDNVKQTASGKYELVAGTQQQPKFNSLPDLVDHYCKDAPGAPYMLSVSNPVDEVYDNANDRAPMDLSGGNAPALPNKAGNTDGVSNPMYGADMSGMGATYADADGAYAPNDGAGGYLDIANSERERTGSMNNSTYAGTTQVGDFKA